MMNPSELLTKEQQAACEQLGVNLTDLDNAFWAKIKGFEREAYLKDAIAVYEVDPSVAVDIAARVPR